MDKVPTTAPQSRSRGNLRALERGRRQNQVRHRWRVAEAARLVAIERLSYKDAAKRLGVSYGHFVGRLWPEAERLTSSDYWVKEERECIGMFVVDSLRAVLRESARKVTESAAHGMTAINAAKALTHIFGISASQSAATTCFADYDEALAVSSPVLSGRKHLVEIIRARRAESVKTAP